MCAVNNDVDLTHFFPESEFLVNNLCTMWLMVMQLACLVVCYIRMTECLLGVCLLLGERGRGVLGAPTSFAPLCLQSTPSLVYLECGL